MFNFAHSFRCIALFHLCFQFFFRSFTLLVVVVTCYMVLLLLLLLLPIHPHSAWNGAPITRRLMDCYNLVCAYLPKNEIEFRWIERKYKTIPHFLKYLMDDYSTLYSSYLVICFNSWYSTDYHEIMMHMNLYQKLTTLLMQPKITHILWTDIWCVNAMCRQNPWTRSHFEFQLIYFSNFWIFDCKHRWNGQFVMIKPNYRVWKIDKIIFCSIQSIHLHQVLRKIWIEMRKTINNSSSNWNSFFILTTLKDHIRSHITKSEHDIGSNQTANQLQWKRKQCNSSSYDGKNNIWISNVGGQVKISKVESTSLMIRV